MINAIFFDVGGTLIHPDISSLMAPLLERITPTPDDLRFAECAAKRRLNLKENGGRVNSGHWSIYFEALLARIGSLDLLPALVSRADNSDHWTQVDAAAGETLQRLRSQYRLGVISNADGRIQDVLWRAGLLDLFHTIVDSRLVGFEKPDPRIFATALRQMNAQPQESLYVGDIYEIDYLGASSAGMNALLLDPQDVYAGWKVERVRSLRELPGVADKWSCKSAPTG